MWVFIFFLYRYVMNFGNIISCTVKDNSCSWPLKLIGFHCNFHWCQHFSVIYFYLLFQHTNAPSFSVHHLLQWCELEDWRCDHTLGICCCWRRGSKLCSHRLQCNTNIRSGKEGKSQSCHSMTCGGFLVQSTTWVSQLSFCMCFVLPNSSCWLRKLVSVPWCSKALWNLVFQSCGEIKWAISTLCGWI